MHTYRSQWLCVLFMVFHRLIHLLKQLKIGNWRLFISKSRFNPTNICFYNSKSPSYPPLVLFAFPKKKKQIKLKKEKEESRKK